MKRNKKKITEHSDAKLVSKSHKREKIKHNNYLYDGVTLKSGLELTCYKELQKSGLNFTYETIQFTLIDAITSSIDSYQPTKSNNAILKLSSKKLDSIKYTPDFIIWDKDGNVSDIIEIKGLQNETFSMRWKLFKRYMTIINSPATIYIVKNKAQLMFTINKIKESEL